MSGFDSDKSTALEFATKHTDTDAHKNEIERSDDRLAAVLNHTNIYFWEYDIVNGTMRAGSKSISNFGMPEFLTDYPQSFVNAGYIHPDYENEYLRLHEEMKKGAPSAEAIIKLRDEMSDAWYRVRLTNSFDENGKPVLAYATAECMDAYMEIEERFAAVTRRFGIETWSYEIALIESVFANAPKDEARLAADVIVRIPAQFSRRRVHPDDVDMCINAQKRLVAGKQHSEARFRLKNDSDGWNWFKAAFALTPGRDGRENKASASMINIDSQMEAETRFLAFQTYKRFAGEKTESVYRMNLTRNRCAEGNMGESSTRTSGKNITVDEYFENEYGRIPLYEDYLAYKAEFSRNNLLSSYFSGRKTIKLEYRRRSETKRTVWYCVTADMMENPYTRDIEAFIYMSDITRERTSRVLIDRLVNVGYEYIAMLDITSDAVSVLSEKRPGCSHLQDMKDAYTRTYAEWLSGFVTKAVLAEAVEAFDPTNIVTQLNRQEPYEVTFPVTMSEDENDVCYKRWQFFYLDKMRAVIAFTQSDITGSYGEKQRQYNELQDALYGMKRVNMAKNGFLTRMSHDMRTPLNGIIGLINLTKDEELSPVARENLEKMEVSSKYLLSVINDTLDVNRAESKVAALNPETVDGGEFMRSLVASVMPTINEKGIRFTMTELNMNYARVRLDRVRVQQIMTNIISNAVKFTQQGGRIDFVAERMETNDKRVRDVFVLRDSGVGMSRDFLPHIFEPFEQEHSSQNFGYGGAGLGMTIAKNLVDLMGGRIDVQSKLGVGTEVTVWLDFDIDGAEPPARRQTAETEELTGKRILLCEDHPLNMEIAKRLLEKAGCIVEHAKNGHEAVDMFAASELGYYDTVLMDIRMPIMDGLVATKVIRAMKRKDAKTVPIIAMTANAFDHDVELSREAGMNRHLTKPVQPAELYSSIIECMRR